MSIDDELTPAESDRLRGLLVRAAESVDVDQPDAAALPAAGRSRRRPTTQWLVAAVVVVLAGVGAWWLAAGPGTETIDVGPADPSGIEEPLLPAGGGLVRLPADTDEWVPVSHIPPGPASLFFAGHPVVFADDPEEPTQWVAVLPGDVGGTSTMDSGPLEYVWGEGSPGEPVFVMLTPSTERPSDLRWITIDTTSADQPGIGISLTYLGVTDDAALEFARRLAALVVDAMPPWESMDRSTPESRAAFDISRAAVYESALSAVQPPLGLDPVGSVTGEPPERALQFVLNLEHRPTGSEASVTVAQLALPPAITDIVWSVAEETLVLTRDDDPSLDAFPMARRRTEDGLRLTVNASPAPHNARPERQAQFTDQQLHDLLASLRPAELAEVAALSEATMDPFDPAWLDED